MLEGFVGVIMICMITDPNNCMVINGPVVSSEILCQADLLSEGLPAVEEYYSDAYVAGLTCMEVYLQGEPA